MALQSSLIQVILGLSRCRDEDAVVDVLRRAARRLTGADGITVVLRDGDLCHYVEEDAIAPLWKGRRFPMQACISGWAMLHREQVAIPDICADARIPQDAYRPTFVRSLAMTPIRMEEPVGALGAYWAQPHTATAEELAVLQALGDSASTALANVQLIAALQDANRRKDQFLSMLAHELRNPLAPVRNALHLMEACDQDPAVVARARALMERQVAQLTRLVDGLLDTARVAHGKLSLVRERLDLVNLVRQATEDRRAVLEAAGLHLDLELPPEGRWVLGDGPRLCQVVGNLLDNAGKFTPRGGQVTVSVVPEPATGQVAVTVQDNGVGLEPELLAHVFDVFSQADRSLDRSQGGLGLGLPVARGLVELHGGTLQAVSPGLGHGAAFTFRLPEHRDRPALAAVVVPDPEAPRALRVLVVEDNRDSAESLQLLLESAGHQVAVAFTGPDGVAAAAALHPDVVLCDLGLPGMDGYAVAGQLRGNPQTRTARLYAVTGYGEDGDRRRALSAGFDAHFTKPVDPKQLLGMLASLGA